MSTPNAKEFEVGDILTMMTGRLVARTHIAAVYSIGEHLTGQAGLMTHQLPRVMRESRDHLRASFPDLAKIEIPDLGPSAEAWAVWLSGVDAEHGRTRMVEPLPTGDHTIIDPLDELAMIRPGLPVIGVVLPETEAP